MGVGEASRKRIKQLCQARSITINKLAIISGVPQSTLSGWINRGIKNPKISTIKKICDGLEISLFEFFNCELFNTLEQELR